MSCWALTSCPARSLQLQALHRQSRMPLCQQPRLQPCTLCMLSTAPSPSRGLRERAQMLPRPGRAVQHPAAGCPYTCPWGCCGRCSCCCTAGRTATSSLSSASCGRRRPLCWALHASLLYGDSSSAPGEGTYLLVADICMIPHASHAHLARCARPLESGTARLTIQGLSLQGIAERLWGPLHGGPPAHAWMA